MLALPAFKAYAEGTKAALPASVNINAPVEQPAGAVEPYNPGALPLALGNADTVAKWPAWRRSLHRWQWTQIPGTDLSSVVPDPAVPGSLKARIGAWNGLAADTRTSLLYSAANGGHADYSGNEVYGIDLSVDTPHWVMLRAPTSEADILKSDYSKDIFNDYYRDGRPASTHTYYALQFLASRNAIFKFGAGSLWGTGNEGNWKTDAFSLSAKDWQPAGSWPDVVPNSRKSVLAASICMNPTTEEVYIAAPGSLRRFDPALGTYKSLSPWPQNSTAVTARGCAFDPIRNRVVFFGDGYRRPDGGLVYDVATNTLSSIRFSGPAAVDVTTGKYNYVWYDEGVGQFLLKTSVADQVYAVDPATFRVTILSTVDGASMPDAMNGVQTRWQQLPRLGGYAYYPRPGSGIWFLATE